MRKQKNIKIFYGDNFLYVIKIILKKKTLQFLYYFIHKLTSYFCEKNEQTNL